MLVAATAARAEVFTRVWDSTTDFAGGESYAVEPTTLDPLANGADVALTLRHQADYAQDSLACSGLSYWCKLPPVYIFPVRGLHDAMLDHQVVRVRNRIYLIGGNAKLECNCSACTSGCPSPTVTVSQVYFTEITPAGDLPFTWTMCGYAYGQTATAPTGIPISKHRAVAVGDRIYVVGGSTNQIQTSTTLTGERDATTAVFSALVDPVTGQTGPWEQELPLPIPVAAHGLVQAAGALYVIGGYINENFTPTNFVHRAQIRPDGHLSSSDNKAWDAVTSVPPASPPGTCALCSLCSCSSCQPCSEGCCKALNICLGWMWMAPFSFMRTIGFYGGALQSLDTGTPCTYYRGAWYTSLDDCNGVAGWTSSGGTSIDALRASTAVAADGTMLVVGGQASSGAFSNVLFNPPPRAGVLRAQSTDREELRPAFPDGLELFKAGLAASQDMALAVVHPPLVTWTNSGTLSGETMVYCVGGAPGNATSASDEIFRSRLVATTSWVDAGSWLSPAYDLGSTYQLTRVAWSFSKSGAGRDDDWAMLRYRVADETGTWTCWTPRIPEEASLETAPGYYTYASDSASVLYRQPRIPGRFQYIQFEVSLYNDNANDAPAPTLPKFDRFEISYEPVPPPRKVVCPLEVYPVPATEAVTLRFEAVPDGGEFTAEVYNAAAELVMRQSFGPYVTGGVKEEKLVVNRLSNGAYMLLLKGVSRGGGAGVVCAQSGERVKKVRGKFLVRR